jgi:hypothetical protein
MHEYRAHTCQRSSQGHTGHCRFGHRSVEHPAAGELFNQAGSGVKYSRIAVNQLAVDKDIIAQAHCLAKAFVYGLGERDYP